jgi:Domain of unknown function (DUF4340)
MRFRGLLAGVAVLAALVVGLYFSNKQQAREAAKPKADEPPKLISVNSIDITKIDLKKKDTPDTILERSAAGDWQLTAPKPYRADQDSANELATSAGAVIADKVVEAKASNLATYGLQSPALEADVTSKKGKTSKLLIGDDTPTNSGSYAMLEGDPRVFTIASWVKTGLDKTPDQLRDKRLLTFDQDKVSRVELIAKKEDIDFGRDKDQWQIIKPRPLRADGTQVDDLLGKVKNAKMDLSLSAEDAKKNASTFASAAPVATVKVTDPSGTQTLEIRKSKDDYYAKSSSVAGVYKVTSDVATGVDKSLEDFRNKKLFDFGFSDPSKIEMHFTGKAYAFQKGGDDWFANGKKMDNISVLSLLDKLRDLSATKFVDSGSLGATVDDLTVTSNNGKRVEKVLISKEGSDYLAKRENEPSLYMLDSKTVDDLSKAASDVKVAPPANKK